MSASPSHLRPAAAALGAVLALALPALASAATVGNPQVIRLDASGTQTVVGGGAPWTDLGGIAVDAANTVYVANQGPIGPTPTGAGIYTLANANTASQPTAFTPLVTGSPTYAPQDVILNGNTLYSLDEDKVISAPTTAPATQTVLSSGQLYDSLGVDPEFGAVAGTTLYTTASGSCDSVGGGGAYVIAVNLATGTQTQVADLGCAALGGVAVEPAGTLLVAETTSSTTSGNTKATPQIVRVNPATGKVSTLGTGAGQGLLRTPQGISYAGDANLYVADTTAGIIQVNPTTGHQLTVAAPGGKSSIGGAYGIVQAADGAMYVSEAGIAPTLKASAASRQKLTSKGIVFKASCNRTCTVAYDASIRIPGGSSYAQDAAFTKVKATKSLAIKLPSSVNKRIASALKKGRTPVATLTITPQDPNTSAPGKSTKLVVKLTK